MQDKHIQYIWVFPSNNVAGINKQFNNKSGINFTLLVGGIIALACLLLAYLMFFTAPEENKEMVKVIAIMESGCIAETLDGFSVNIGDFNA